MYQLWRFRVASWALFAAIVLAGTSCGGTKATPVVPEEIWSIQTSGGFESSPALCDLDGDGKQELIFPVSDELIDVAEVLAIDPATGDVLWRNQENHRAYSYPYCADVSGDGVKDVLVAGRSGDVVALSGADGSQLWRLSSLNSGTFPAVTVNMHTVVAADSASSIFFVTYRGDRAAPAAGGIIAFDDNGAILAVWAEPGGREVYSSAAVYGKDSTHSLVAFGSGGETLPGALYVLEFNSTTNTFLVKGSLPSHCLDGGVEASPMFGDLDGDGTPEVVATDYCGTVFATDLNAVELWSGSSPVLYGTSNPVLADLDRDGRLDVVAIFESANFSLPPPEVLESRMVAFKGLDGTALWSTGIPTIVIGSPLTLDFNRDGVEDILVPEAGMFTTTSPQGPNGMSVIDGITGHLITRINRGNQMSTPVFDDVDGDGSVELFAFESGFDMNDPVGTAGNPSYLLGMRLDHLPYEPDLSFSGFRGHPVHNGRRD